MTKYEYCKLYDETVEMCAAKGNEKSGERLPGDAGRTVHVTREEALRETAETYNVVRFFSKAEYTNLPAGPRNTPARA